MYTNIMIPVDLSHTDRLDKALGVATDLAKLYGAAVHVVGVGQNQPTEVARTPAQYTEKLSAFAAEKSKSLGVALTPHVEISHDPAVDLDAALERAAKALKVDLVVMSSHVPGAAEHLFSSNAGYLASHAHISVFIVR